jgi:hypothetical protein
MWMKGHVATAGADHEVQMVGGNTHCTSVIGHVGGSGKVHSSVGGA